MELAPFDITFVARTAIKRTPQLEEQPPRSVEAPWTIYTDESWCATGAGAAAILVALDGRSVSYTAPLDFPTTNNTS